MNAKYYQKDQKNKSVGIVRVAAVVLILLSAGLLYQMYVETHFQIYDSALRFHVRAASDAPEDQRRKLLVRDAVLWEIRPEADQAESAGELVERIEEMLPEIADVAAGVLRGAGAKNSRTANVLSEDSDERARSVCVRRSSGSVFLCGATETCCFRRGNIQRCGWISERPGGITGGVQFTRNYVIMQRSPLPCQGREKRTWKEMFPGKKDRCFSGKKDGFG